MNRQEFEQLRDLPGKRITADIVFSSHSKAGPNRVFEQVQVENSLELDVVLNGTYKPDIPSITFNFVIRGVGPICRIDVNGTIHGAAGRTHKHDLQRDSDPRTNLPDVVPRPDLVGKSPREVWEILCKQAGMIHTGNFVDP